MGRLYLVQLDGRRVYGCRYCRSHLALYDDVISKSFHCRTGKAYLFESVVNVYSGVLEERMMTTGMHTVADIFCNQCGQILGWKYESAAEKSQKYKEGKFILERGKISESVPATAASYVDLRAVGSVGYGTLT